MLGAHNPGTFPSCRELFDAGALDRIQVNISDLLQGETIDGLYYVSHRWEDKAHPFPAGRTGGLSEKLAALLTVLEENIMISHVWIDYACLPQGAMSPIEEDFFYSSLESISFLYLTQSVVLMIDLEFSSRFWCCYEGFFATHKASSTGIVTQTPSEIDARTIFKEYGAANGYLRELFLQIWSGIDVNEAMEKLRKDDIHVTSVRDKDKLIPKMAGLEMRVRDIFMNSRASQRQTGSSFRRRAAPAQRRGTARDQVEIEMGAASNSLAPPALEFLAAGSQMPHTDLDADQDGCVNQDEGVELGPSAHAEELEAIIREVDEETPLELSGGRQKLFPSLKEGESPGSITKPLLEVLHDDES